MIALKVLNLVDTNYGVELSVDIPGVSACFELGGRLNLVKAAICKCFFDNHACIVVSAERLGSLGKDKVSSQRRL